MGYKFRRISRTG